MRFSHLSDLVLTAVFIAAIFASKVVFVGGPLEVPLLIVSIASIALRIALSIRRSLRPR